MSRPSIVGTPTTSAIELSIDRLVGILWSTVLSILLSMALAPVVARTTPAIDQLVALW
jgi:hypothetical protein